MTRPIDPEIFRRQARGENVGMPRFAGTGDLAAVRWPEGAADFGKVWKERQLCFVVSGEISLRAAGDPAERLGRGDVFLVDAPEAPGLEIFCSGETRLLHLRVNEEFVPDGISDDTSETSSTPAGAVQLARMYKGDDDQSYFRSFDMLFAGAPGMPGQITPVTGFHFVEFPDGSFIDWHPEGVNNFVIVLTGCLELEVGGGEGEVRRFGPGDICLAEDRTGVGHIDRVYGTCRLALLVMEDRDLWPAASAADPRAISA